MSKVDIYLCERNFCKNEGVRLVILWIVWLLLPIATALTVKTMTPFHPFSLLTIGISCLITVLALVGSLLNARVTRFVHRRYH